MKARDRIIFIGCCLALAYGLYLKYFSKIIKANTVVNQVKTGMTRQQVIATLSKPDTVYWKEPETDSFLVMRYNRPDKTAAADTLYVSLRHDTVMAVTYRHPRSQRK